MESSSNDRLITTQDGTHTLYHSVLNQHYHSLQGSLQESMHIFIQLGLIPFLEAFKEEQKTVRVFEMGFGTGLNALLTWKFAENYQSSVAYTGVEAYPISENETQVLNFGEIIHFNKLDQLHGAEWGIPTDLSDVFKFTKHHSTLHELELNEKFDLIYYDAFAPEAQPELWTEEIFRKLGNTLSPGGVLVTYSSKGIVRRALQAAGFRIEKHPGPGRKREIVKAIYVGF